MLDRGAKARASVRGRATRVATLAAAAIIAIATGLAGVRIAVAATNMSLTVEQAVSWALRDNPRLGAARRRLEGRADTTSAAGRRMLPAVHLGEEWQRYDRGFNVNFGGAAFPVRDQTTNTFSASASQPVLELFRLENERAALAEGQAAAEANLGVTEADLRVEVETQFLRYFEARAMKQIAETSARELSDEVSVNQARLASGVITEADLLRLQVAIANAQQQALQAGSQAAAARASLFATIGLPAAESAGVELVEPRALLSAARAAPAPMESLLPGARAHRPEIARQAHLALSTDRDARARGYALLPDVDLEAAYVRIDGQQFAPKNSAYVGVKAEWGIWEWGADMLRRRAALAEAAAAQREAEGVDREVEADLTTSLAQGDAARGAVDAAEKAIASAEEAYRVTEAQTKAGTATTTDLLEAQAALTQARLNLTRAEYELALAHVTLTRATGDGG